MPEVIKVTQGEPTGFSSTSEEAAGARPPSPVEPSLEDVVVLPAEDLATRDPWVPLKIMEDVCSTSIVPVVDQLIKSHLHRAAGACRWLEKDVVVWTSCELSKIKKSFGVLKDIVPWEKPGGGCKGSYSLFTTPTDAKSGWGGSQNLKYWGLAPAMQTLVFEDDTILRELGCYMEEVENPFLQENKQPLTGVGNTIKYVAMKYDWITKAPWCEKLAGYCGL